MQPGRTSALALLLCLGLAAAALATDDGAERAHAGIECGRCHDAGEAFAPVDDAAPAATADPRLAACVACHGSAPTASPFHDRGGASCLRCHSFHAPREIRAGEQVFTAALGSPGTGDHCRSCHRPGAALDQLDAGHRAAAAVVYHSDEFDLAALTPSEGCLLCHDRGQAAVAMPADAPPVPRFHTEASHVHGVAVRPGQGSGPRRIRDQIDPRLELPQGRLECQTCHRLTGGARSLLVPFDNPYAMCLGCHQVRQRDRDAGPLTLAAQP